MFHALGIKVISSFSISFLLKRILTKRTPKKTENPDRKKSKSMPTKLWKNKLIIEQVQC